MTRNASDPDPGEVTRLLRAASGGDADASGALFPLVYEELRRVAASCMRRERRDHTLQPTALVHEAFLRLTGDASDWESRAHFLGTAAKAMRRILVNHARDRKRLKRGGDAVRVSFDDAATPSPDGLSAPDLVALDDALVQLEALDAVKARIVELRFFAGLSHEEVAKVIGASERSVRRHWTFARAWLRSALDDGTEPDA